jgi:hexosaminidase
VNKWSGSYPQRVNIAKTFNGNPANNGPWQPNIFDVKNSTNNPERSNKYIFGAIAPLWNDYGANASVYSETYYAWREGIPALADKQWGGDLSQAEFSSVFPNLRRLIPGQNLERSIPSKTSTILHYDINSWKQEPHSNLLLDDISRTDRIPVSDKSGNNYTATTTCAITQNNTLQVTPACSLKTPFSSKGRNYTLALRLNIKHTSTTSDDSTIISGADSTLMLTPNITFFASGNYYRLNSTLPLKAWVDLRITGRGDRTFASVRESSLQDPFPFPRNTDANGLEKEEEFQAVLGINGQSFVWAPIAIEAPIAELGGSAAGWAGEFAGLSLTSED